MPLRPSAVASSKRKFRHAVLHDDTHGEIRPPLALAARPYAPKESGVKCWRFILEGVAPLDARRQRERLFGPLAA